MKQTKTLFLIVALCLVAVQSWAAPIPKTQPMAAFSVMSFGAKADGKTDDTVAFQKALSAAAPKGGIVLAPAGRYLIAGSLTITEGVTLRGVWEAPHRGNISKGTTLLATGGAGDENAKPLIRMADSGCVKGLTIFYPDQRFNKITPYPWTISGAGTHISVIDVSLVNSYKGIKIVSEQHYIKNVFGCVLTVGIEIDGCTDIGRIEDIHFNPHYWMRSGDPNAPTGDGFKTVIEYLNKNLVAFRIGKTDWEYMLNCFCIFAKIGYHFVKTNVGEANVVLTQCGSDIGATAVQVDAVQGHAGIAFVNSQLMARVIVGPNNKGPVKFSNCGFWPVAETDNQAVIEGRGTVTFANCSFNAWGMKDVKSPCIWAKTGAVIVNACEFMASKPQVTLEEGIVSAVISSNRMRGGVKITNNSKGDVQIGLNSGQ